ncbi:MAG: 2-oxoglutarate dehydrogenase complex dihydrolipoyllysine-residue succinyltransferase [Thermoflavifilum sp.]|nr:2-oxoglutarate dehydrogenase complex dihydrolipoyllysine-residue succinyltransferase [Thermoflavifilum sp.]MCL6514131.1 2-oxoglutarate dehydrogenase complex dihydrolipoyllysine-residue succinyltransferase [Alicyclobacillus sp.]
MSEIRVPELGESIVEATILNWLKNVGDPVSQGEAVAELETDKVNVEVISEQSGVLQQILRQAGETVKVGEAIAVIGEGAAAQPSADAAPAAAPGTAAPQAAAPAAPFTPAQPQQAPASAPAAAAAPVAPATLAATSPAQPASPGAAPVASPAVRRLALEYGVDLSRVQGTGGLGRITEQDVLNAARAQQSVTLTPAPAPVTPAPAGAVAPAPPRPTAPAPTAGTTRPDEQRIPMSRRRLTIARNLKETQNVAALLTTFNEVDMSAVLDIRKRRREEFKQKHGVSLGFMSFFTKAVVGALKAYPMLNAEIDGSDIILKQHYDIGIAVSTNEGLVVPVVRDADKLTFAEIERKIAELAEKARSKTLSLADLQGGTFTITNGGVFGSLMSTPILNGTHQVGILGMHKIQERPVAINGEVVIRPMMYIALTYDHRIIDGAEAVSFLVKVKELIEDPESLLLEG